MSENMHFSVIFQYLQIQFTVNCFGVDQMLTQTLQIDHTLTFNVFHILNQCRIPKLKKYLMVQIQSTDPFPSKKNGHFFLGGGAGCENRGHMFSEKKLCLENFKTQFDWLLVRLSICQAKGSCSQVESRSRTTFCGQVIL